MSERITAANLDEVIKRNEVIEEQMKQSASLIWSKYNPMQINSPIQLALQILRPYGLIQLPINNHYLSGAIFVRDGKRIPLINTALPRANQYFTAWHEIYHLLFDEVSFDHLIESEILMEERKAEYFAALMLLGNLMPYFEGLKDMEFQAKAFQCMNAFQAPYKAVLISLYESAVKNGNTAIAEEVKENFDVQVEDIAQRFRDLGLDDSLVRPSYVVNVSPLQEKINKTIFYLLGSVLLATAILSYLMQQSQGMEALQMLIGGFVIFMIPQVVGGVVVLLELAAVMLRQIWYI